MTLSHSQILQYLSLRALCQQSQAMCKAAM